MSCYSNNADFLQFFDSQAKLPALGVNDSVRIV